MHLIVLGMHRSGTSLVTRLLNLMGAYFGGEGSSTDKGFGNQNPKGFWERRDVRSLNDLVLRQFGCDWDRVSALDVSKLPPKKVQSFTEKAKLVILNMDSHRPWVMKDPRLCLTFPLWRPILEVPVAIHVTRNPLQVARSLQTRNGFPINLGLALWEKYNLEALRGSIGLPRLFLDHETFLENPVKSVQLLYQRLTDYAVDNIRVPSEREILRFIEPSLFRSKGSLDTLERYANKPQIALYEAFLSGEAFRWKTPPEMSAGGLETLCQYEKNYEYLKMLKQTTIGLQQDLEIMQVRRGKAGDHPSKLKKRLAKLQETPDMTLGSQEKELQLSADLHKLQASGKAFETLTQEFQTTLKSVDNDQQQSLAMIDHLKLQEAHLSDRYQDMRQEKKRVEILYNHKKEEYLTVKRAYDSIRASNLWKFGILVNKVRNILLLKFLRKDSTPAQMMSPSPVKAQEKPEQKPAKKAVQPTITAVDVIVCVHNALEDVQRCLASVIADKSAHFNLIIVNDGSQDPTTAYLRQFVKENSLCQLIENEQAGGYTKAANQGLRAATGNFSVLLNSDTIVPQGWLKRMLEALESDPKAGIAGPLSNAASYQSVPKLRGDDGDWAINDIPKGMELAQVDQLINFLSPRAFPKAAFVNGFCFGIKREVIDKIGYLDEANFPKGYGEENDFCMRAAQAGFTLVIADHTHVYHAKSKSFSHTRRRKLAKAGGNALAKKHGKDKIRRGTQALQDNAALSRMRRLLATVIETDQIHLQRIVAMNPKVLFLLPVSGGGGGVHSIVQEVAGMRAMGFGAQIALRKRNKAHFLNAYPTHHDCFFFYSSQHGLEKHAAAFNICVATIFTSVKILEGLIQENPKLIPAYYIQDYEPNFCEKGSELEQEALISYTRIPHILAFAKTPWLGKTVSEKHDISVAKVAPSIDNALYYFDPKARQKDGPITICAMVRPKTPRRAPGLTMKVLKTIKEAFAEKVRIVIFGCQEDDPLFQKLDRDFEYENRGILIREEVAQLLRASEILIDLSTYQAFGRTGLEAMAAGCAVMVPSNCGPDEYAIHELNAMVTDTADEAQILKDLRHLIEDDAARQRIAANAVETGLSYSTRRAALRELEIFARALEARQKPKTTQA